jgi:hypothetical protein
MTDKKTTVLPSFVSPLALTDLMPVVQDVLTTPETRKMTYDQLIQELSGVFAAAAIDLFLENTASDIAGYKSLVITPPAGAETNDSVSVAAADTVINEYASLANVTSFIATQVVHAHLHLAQTAGTKTSKVYTKLFHRTSGGTETLIGTSELSVNLTGSSAPYEFDMAVSDRAFLATDRVVLKVYATPAGGGSTPTVVNYFQGVNYSRVSFNSAAGSPGITNFPVGQMRNGKILPTVASNNLTLTLLTATGGTPSTTDPVYVNIDGTIRTITAALSVTKNAATNWCNAGSAELATKEIDYFAYLGYNATDGIVIGFSRIPHATIYSDFSATTTNEKYCAISTITNAAAGDNYMNIGRFAATLSAGAGYTWSVPTFTGSNLIQRPILYTRELTWTPVTTCSGSLTYGTITNTFANYKIDKDQVIFELSQTGTLGGSASNTIYNTIPFDSIVASANNIGGGVGTTSGGVNAALVITNGTPDLLQCRKYDISNYATSGSNTNSLAGSYRI